MNQATGGATSRAASFLGLPSPATLLALLVAAVLGVVIAVGIVLFRSWSLALILTGMLALAAIPTLFGARASERLCVFFGLLAASDFAKRSTFLAADQALWSQYLLVVLPSAYFGLFVFVPWFVARFDRMTVFDRLVLAFMAVAMVNTWIAAGVSPVGKAAATGLLILPWAMIAVGASYPRAVSGVGRILVGWGVASALYGVCQFLLGPTPVEVRWAQAVGDASIGASAVAQSLDDGSGSRLMVWRIHGLQPDAFTFGLFLLTALAFACFLRAQGTLSGRVFVVAVAILGLAAFLSLVRTTWAAMIAFVGFVWLARCFPVVEKPRGLLSLFVGAFLLLEVVASQISTFYQFGREFAPFVSRALTLGTLDARIGAVSGLLAALPDLWLYGFGFGASPWFIGKFATSLELPRNFAFHSGLIELLWYVGLPGMVLFVAILWRALAGAERRDPQSAKRWRPARTVLVAYVFAMMVSSLASGSVFLNYHFFFALGALASWPPRDPDMLSVS